MSDNAPVLATVTEILDLLIAHGDKYVVKRMQGYRAELEDGDRGVVSTLHIEANGGMGSLRDRYLCASNGDRITEAEREDVNARLSMLVERLAQQTLPPRPAVVRQ